jgi:hypothetical protein
MKEKQPKQKRYRVSFDIPIPGRDNRYPFERMKKVGASFGFPKKEANKVRNAAHVWRKNGRGSMMFLTRINGAKGRIWRVR